MNADISLPSKNGNTLVFGLKPSALKKTFLDLINGKNAVWITLSSTRSNTVSSATTRWIILLLTLVPDPTWSWSTGIPHQFQDQLFQLNAFLVDSLEPPWMILSWFLSTSLHSSDAGDNVATPS